MALKFLPLDEPIFGHYMRCNECEHIGVLMQTRPHIVLHNIIEGNHVPYIELPRIWRFLMNQNNRPITPVAFDAYQCSRISQHAAFQNRVPATMLMDPAPITTYSYHMLEDSMIRGYNVTLPYPNARVVQRGLPVFILHTISGYSGIEVDTMAVIDIFAPELNADFIRNVPMPPLKYVMPNQTTQFGGLKIIENGTTSMEDWGPEDAFKPSVFGNGGPFATSTPELQGVVVCRSNWQNTAEFNL